MTYDQPVYIEITNNCNMNCRHCYNASGSSKKSQKLSPEVLEKIFVSMNMYQELTTFDISGGEPLMHTQWEQILDVMEKFRSFSFFVVTNGTIKDERFNNLLETDNRYTVQFSIDGVDEDTHAKTRGKGNYVKTLKNLSLLKPKNQPIIKMVVSRYNMNQIKEYFELAVEHWCKPSFAFAERMGHANDHWPDMSLNEYEKLRVIEQINTMRKKFNIETKLPYATFRCPLIKESEALSICIKSNGSIQPCQNLYDDQFSIGSVYDLDFSVIQINIGGIRRRLMERQKMDFNCDRCINRNDCEKGCAATAFMHYGHLDAVDGACQFRRLQTAKIHLMKIVEARKGINNI